MEEEIKQEGTLPKAEQAQPENENENIDDILNKTIIESPKETDAKPEPSKEVTEPKEEKDSSEPKTDSSDSLQPRADFDNEEKELFNSLDENRKKLMLNKWAKLESGFNKKFENLANERKVAEEFTKTYEPYKQQMDIAGVSPMQYTKQLIAADKFIRENPAEGIKWLAQNHSVDLSKLSQSPAEQDPITDKINELDKKIENVNQEFSNRDLSVLAKQIEDFKTAKDKDGNLKYPHFDTVKNEMAKLNTATGESNLEKLYSQAIRLNDDLYQKQLDAEIAKRQANAQKQADLAKAKKSNTSLKNSVNANVDGKEYENIDDIMRDTIK